LKRDVAHLYDQASSPSVTADQIDGLGVRLAGLTKNDLVSIAEKIELKGMKAKTKDVVIDSICSRIRARKATTQRAGLIDRPTPPTEVDGHANAPAATKP
jgi:hypothetical protein